MFRLLLVAMVLLVVSSVVLADVIKPGDVVEIEDTDCAQRFRGTVIAVDDEAIEVRTDEGVLRFDRAKYKQIRLIESATRTGWHEEAVPKGMRKSSEQNVYLWRAPGGLEIQMVYVPPGEFRMGSHEQGWDLRTNGRQWQPVHTHPMPQGYYIGRYETTWREYLAFCEAAKRSKPDAPEWGVENDHPVVNVSWGDAKAFCDWAGLGLPTEAQWEKAARGTDGRRFPWGREGPGAGSAWRANYSPGPIGGHDADGFLHTAPVGSYARFPSPYGAHDMAGNVAEWCADWYDRKSYARYARGDTAPPSSGSDRVVRGGDWYFRDGFCRAAFRGPADPSGRYCTQGFRPVKVAP